MSTMLSFQYVINSKKISILRSFFHTKSLKPSVFYTYIISQFALATFQVLNTVATVLDSVTSISFLSA